MSNIGLQTTILYNEWLEGLLEQARIVESSLTDVAGLDSIQAGDRTKLVMLLGYIKSAERFVALSKEPKLREKIDEL